MSGFDKWWADQVSNSTSWTTLERLAAKDAWNYQQQEIERLRTEMEHREKEKIFWQTAHSECKTLREQCLKKVSELKNDRRIKIPCGLFRLLLNILRDDEEKGLRVRGDIANDLEKCANDMEN